ncbi:MAG: aconitate hydratase [Acidobacteriota bacterium]
MGKNITQKIIERRLVSGEMVPGKEIAIRMDQTFTQDATGTMAYLQFEAMGIPKIKTKLSVSYVDHNTIQDGFENADDHLYLMTVAAKYGIHYSRAGNGVCHQVHLERFGVPGDTLIASDSHTPTAGGIGMFAIGAGGIDVAVAMGGGPFYLTMPRIVLVKLSGRLKAWVSAKDVILELLRQLTTKGNVGKVIEYGGEGVKTLSVPERATITNMGAELGVTTSLFPSDEITREFLRAQKRENVWMPLEADPDAVYDEVIEINLSKIEPMVAQPHSPDNVVKVTEIEGLQVDQVGIGSCTNSSYKDLMTVAKILKGKTVPPHVSLIIAPGSRQVLQMITKNGALYDLISAGARIMESACGFCIGNSQAPRTDAVSVRTINRNFEGRSGTKSARVYLVSPETAAACAIYGMMTDPRKLGKRPPRMAIPKECFIDDSMIVPPSNKPEEVKIYRGPNIGDPPRKAPLADKIVGEVLLKVGDKITTDHIMPAGARLKYRSNVPKYAQFVFEGVDPTFAERAKAKNGGFLVGGLSYGQGSSREHAAICPMYLGVKGVIAKSLERIHTANLINFGIIPMTFKDPSIYDQIDQGDHLEIENLLNNLKSSPEITVKNLTKGTTFTVVHNLTPRQADIIMAGGLLNFTRLQHS